MSDYGMDEAKAAQINAWVQKYNLRLRALTEVEASRVAKLYHEAIATDHAEALRMNANRDAETKTPEPEDTIEQLSSGRWFMIEKVEPDVIVYHGIGLDLTAGAIKRPYFSAAFKIVASEAWALRADRCANEWHRSAPIRGRQLCPECPA